MRCEGLIKEGAALKLCNVEIEGAEVFKHGEHCLCAECILNLRFDCRERKWMYYLRRLSYYHCYFDEYDYEEKVRQLKVRER